MAERSIVEILKCQDTLLDKLTQVLKEEHDILKDRKALNLNEINENKSKYLLELQANDQSIKAHSQKDRLLSDLKPIKELLVNKLSACQKQNEVNGRLIELNLAANRRLASSLIQLRDTNTTTYDIKGNKNALRGKHFNFEA
jgi:flagellar biosynthesis protein FlgN